MPFQKGVSGNPSGKPKGTKHNTSDEAIRDFLRSKFTDYYMGVGDLSFMEDLKDIKPSMRLQTWEKFLKYFIATMAALKVEGDVNVNQSGTVKIEFNFDDKDVNDDMQKIINDI